jgi:hypothetical protein
MSAPKHHISETHFKIIICKNKNSPAPWLFSTDVTMKTSIHSNDLNSLTVAAILKYPVEKKCQNFLYIPTIHSE